MTYCATSKTWYNISNHPIHALVCIFHSFTVISMVPVSYLHWEGVPAIWASHIRYYWSTPYICRRLIPIIFWPLAFTFKISLILTNVSRWKPLIAVVCSKIVALVHRNQQWQPKYSSLLRRFVIWWWSEHTRMWKYFTILSKYMQIMGGSRR